MFKLGDRVAVDVNDALFRVRRSKSLRKEWVKLRRGNAPDVREGIVMGYRTYSNGDVEYHYDEATTYNLYETFKVVLVAFKLWEKPLAFHPEDVRPA